MNNKEEYRMVTEIRDFKRELYAAVFANDSKQLLDVWYGPEGEGREAYLLVPAHRAPKIKAALIEAIEGLEKNAPNQE
tara:strand:+ start:748 stop:981 length:234 start_codon:yes stop_codon:yes gene_type:complete